MERRASDSAPATPAILEPAQLLAYVALVSALAWTLVPAIANLAPPLDVAEGYMWGREWPLLTYKHPAMPAWIIEASRVMTFGAIGWPVYLVSQLFVVATIGIVFLLARDHVGGERALLAALPLLFFEHLSWRSPEFNHTIAQLPFWSAVALFAWRAAERGTWSAWICLSLAMAGGMYAKLSHGLIVVVAALWLLYDARSRRQLATPKPWLAGVLGLALIAPIALWFVRNGLQPLDYARSRAAEPSATAAGFLARAALTAVPMLAMLALLAVAARRDGDEPGQPADRLKRRFAVVLTLGPLLLSLLAAGISGSGLRTTWAAPVLTLLPFLLVVALPRLDMPAKSRGVAAAVGILIVAVAVGYGARLFLARPATDGPTRVNWPERAISAAAAAAWSKETGGKPLRIVAGDTWPAGLAAIRHPDRPSILTSGDLSLSPWITSDRLVREGALIVFEPRRPIPDAVKALIGNREPKPLEFYAAGRASGAQLSYVVVPPAP